MNRQKTAIITGGSQGIGLAIASALVSEDYMVVLLSRSDDNLRNAEDKLLSAFPKADIRIQAVDVSDSARVKAVVQSLYHDLGRIDILVNSAGIIYKGSSELNAESYSKMVNINQVGTFNMLEAIVPIMKAQQSGYIFNISSLAGLRVVTGMAGYCSTKYAVTALSNTLSQELAVDNIKVTAICPGMTDTAMTENYIVDNDDKIQLSDIDNTVKYLLSLSPKASVDTVALSCTTVVKDPDLLKKRK
ncbi:putative oxidoreductase [Piscirickettsia salmonis]|uniref:SDR family oxidoreductase n=1 Tax=Piscirickettsia salmonis TaxID=1238 RepID=UPI0012B85DF4|nr:SDR family oxidoreductase [Piscirickettsia salmonis]QGP48790.1 putative oxidoreductase [Piscirickettsia salmonis]